MPCLPNYLPVACVDLFDTHTHAHRAASERLTIKRKRRNADTLFVCSSGTTSGDETRATRRRGERLFAANPSLARTHARAARVRQVRARHADGRAFAAAVVHLHTHPPAHNVGQHRHSHGTDESGRRNVYIRLRVSRVSRLRLKTHTHTHTHLFDYFAFPRFCTNVRHYFTLTCHCRAL